MKNTPSIPPDVFSEGIRLREERDMTVPDIAARLGFSRKAWWHQLRRVAVFRGGRPPARIPRVAEHDHTIERMRLGGAGGAGGESIARAIGKSSAYVTQRLTFITYRQAALEAWREAGKPPPKPAARNSHQGRSP